MIPASGIVSSPLSFRLGSCVSIGPIATARFIRWSRASCEVSHPAPVLVQIHRLTAAQEQRIAQLLNPPVLQGARPLWYQGKVLELMAEFFFERRGDDELFCDRQKRLARERVERVVALLRKNLVEPLSLEEIGRRGRLQPVSFEPDIFTRKSG